MLSRVDRVALNRFIIVIGVTFNSVLLKSWKCDSFSPFEWIIHWEKKMSKCWDDDNGYWGVILVATIVTIDASARTCLWSATVRSEIARLNGPPLSYTSIAFLKLLIHIRAHDCRRTDMQATDGGNRGSCCRCSARNTPHMIASTKWSTLDGDETIQFRWRSTLDGESKFESKQKPIVNFDKMKKQRLTIPAEYRVTLKRNSAGSLLLLHQW